MKLNPYHVLLRSNWLEGLTTGDLCYIVKENPKNIITPKIISFLEFLTIISKNISKLPNHSFDLYFSKYKYKAKRVEWFHVLNSYQITVWMLINGAVGVTLSSGGNRKQYSCLAFSPVWQDSCAHLRLSQKTARTLERDQSTKKRWGGRLLMMVIIIKWVLGTKKNNKGRFCFMKRKKNISADSLHFTCKSVSTTIHSH